jgi:hypothetical protein
MQKSTDTSTNHNANTIKLGALLFVIGIAYAIATWKSPLSILAFGLIGSIAGFAIGTLTFKQPSTNN